tara:strand:+ start:3031 stop:3300 length:270 start_codon:yes stop_codon:yes gene_type:complete
MSNWNDKIEVIEHNDGSLTVQNIMTLEAFGFPDKDSRPTLDALEQIHEGSLLADWEGDVTKFITDAAYMYADGGAMKLWHDEDLENAIA